MQFTEEELKARLKLRVGEACVWCGEIVTNENISLNWCDPCCKKCDLEIENKWSKD